MTPSKNKFGGRVADEEAEVAAAALLSEDSVEQLMIMIYILGLRRGQLHPDLHPRDPKFGKKVRHMFDEDVGELGDAVEKVAEEIITRS